MTDIGELVVRIRADAAQLQRELQNATGTVKSSSKDMGGALGSLTEQFKELIPALTIAAVVEFGKSALESANSMHEMSERIGFAASTLSALNIPLKQNGSSVEEFASAVNILNRNIGLAATGNQEMVQKFDQLGLSVTKLKSMRPEDAFFAVAQALGQTTDQFELANNARALFGRGVAGLLPLIKETGGNLRDFADNAKKAGDALTDEQIEKVHRFEAAWVSALEHMKIGVVDFLTYFEKLGEEHDMLIENMDLPKSKWGGSISHFRPNVPSDDELAKQFRDSAKAKGIEIPGVDSNGKGSNTDLLTPPKDPQLADYIANLKQETAAIGENQKALFVAKAEIEATSKAKEDFNNGLRTSKTLLPGEKQQVDTLAASFYDLKKAQEDNARIAKQMQDALATSLAAIAVNFKSLKDTATNAIQSIAQEIIKLEITEPLSKSIVSALPNFSLGKIFGFASGGNPPVGVPSIVGENGPELFVPNTAGTIVPNNKLGGGSVTVNQSFQVYPGVSETVDAKIRAAAPIIAAQAQAGVFQAMQQGGAASKLTGLRS